MHTKSQAQRKADASYRKYRELLELDKQGAMIPARAIRRARETWKIRQSLADGEGVEL